MKLPKQLKDLTGRMFGRLTVLSYSGCSRPDRPSKKNHQWECLCECGNIKIILGDSLRSGNTTSCGCVQKERTSKVRRIDLTGKTFGRLTALEFSHSDETGQTFWLCECECGNEKLVNSSSLRRGSTKSCNCRQGNYIHGKWGKPGYKAHYLKDPVRKMRHNVGVSVRDSLVRNKGTKQGSSVFDKLPYTPQELKEHLEGQFDEWMNWDNYGGSNDSPNKSWHIDHIKPQCQFSFSSMEDAQFLECWSLTNLRPLEKKENMSRSRLIPN